MLIAARSHLTRTRKTERFVLLCVCAYACVVHVLAMVCLGLCLCCGRPQYVCAYASAYVEVKTKLLERSLL